jgi:two-component system, OmpR family, sensor histidine kinase TctE
MKPWLLSIRRQLLCWLLIPIMSLWLVGAVVTYILAVDFAGQAYDTALLDSAHAVASRLSFKGSTPVFDLPPVALAILKYNDKDDLFYQVLTSKGQLISGDNAIPPPHWTELSKEPDFRDEHIGVHQVRVVAIAVPVPDKPNNDFIVIQVAETLQGREEITGNIILGVVLPQFILIAFAAGAVWFGVARGLKPLRDLQDDVSRRTASDLRPVALGNVPKEVKPLVNAINELLQRLGEDREAQKRFVANAAHQLRTPLAGLKTQTELAERQKDQSELKHSLRQIRTSADRATRLVHQLLALARVEPAVFKTTRKEAVDINAIARDATKELVPLALQKNMDLGFEGLRRPHIVSGDSKSLYEMFSNLIENAILYTQPGGKVTVRIEGKDTVALVVEDNGPGIPEQERERVFERFYRSVDNHNVEGSGLGLAIVREIAEAHDAEVTVYTGPGGVGTSVTVEFPDNVEHNFAPPTESPFARV